MKMDKVLFLILINIMIIFCSNKIKNNKYFETYKNLRYLEEDYVPTTVPSTEPEIPTKFQVQNLRFQQQFQVQNQTFQLQFQFHLHILLYFYF